MGGALWGRCEIPAGLEATLHSAEGRNWEELTRTMPGLPGLRDKDCKSNILDHQCALLKWANQPYPLCLLVDSACSTR